MHLSLPLGLALLLLLFPAIQLHALVGSSRDYSLQTATLDSGGGHGTSGTHGDYSIIAAVGLPSGRGNLGLILNVTGPSLLLHGFTAQLYEISDLVLNSSPNPVDEGTSAQLSSQIFCDDGTRLVIAASNLTWHVVRGPNATLSTAGILTVPLVLTQTNVTVQVFFAGARGSLTLPIVNTNYDNAEGFGGDGLPDDWQAKYFGGNTLAAGPKADPDKDGLSNEVEFARGSNPATADTDGDGIPDAKDERSTGVLPSQRFSADYSMGPETLDSGGGYSPGRTYSQIASLGLLSGLGADSARLILLQHGFAPSLEAEPETGSTNRADLGILLTVAPDPVAPGETLIYTVTITNLGPSTATQIIVTNVLPLEVTLLSVESGTGTWTGDPLVQGEILSLKPFSSAQATITARTLRVGVLTYRASVSAHELDGNSINNTSILTLRSLTLDSKLSTPEFVKGRFQFRLAGAIGIRYRVDVSEDLNRWEPIITNLLPSTGFVDFSHEQTEQFRERFFRASPVR